MLLLLLAACGPRDALPLHLASEISAPPVISDDGYLYWPVQQFTNEGVPYALVMSRDVYGADDPYQFFQTGEQADSFTTPAVADDGFVVWGIWDRLRVTTASLGPWYEVPLPHLAWTTPAIGHDGTLYIGDASGLFHAIHPHGDPKWRAVVDGLPFGSPVIGSDGAITLLVAREDGHRVVTLEPDGTERFAVDVGFTTAPLAIGRDGAILVASSPWPETTPNRPLDSFVVESLDPTTGEVAWETAPGHLPFELLVWGDGDVAVLCGPEDGEVVRLDGRSGQERARSDGYAGITQGVIAEDQDLYLGCTRRDETYGHVCILGRNGQERSSLEVYLHGDPVWLAGRPLLHDGYLVAMVGGQNATGTAGAAGLVAWDLGGSLHTASVGWPRRSGGNAGNGRAP